MRLNTKLLAEFLNEEYVVPKTGHIYAHNPLENEVSPESAYKIVKFTVNNILASLGDIAKQSEVKPQDFIEYILPEVIEELQGWSPHKKIGF